MSLRQTTSGIADRRFGVRNAAAPIGALALLALAPNAHATAIFADWTSANAATLNGVGVSLVGTPFAAVTNGSFTGFSNAAYFSPSVASTDAITIYPSSQAITLNFDQPISNVTLHLYQLANTTLIFNHDFSLVSSDGNFTITPSTVRGISTITEDANGSLLFSGSISSLSWTTTDANPVDGVAFQLSVSVPLPPSAFIGVAGLVGVAGLRGIRRRAARS